MQVQKQLETALLARDFPLARQKLAKLRLLWPGDARLHQAEGALLMVYQQDFAAAREHFLHALRLRPSDGELLFNLAEAEFFLKNYREAEACYRRLPPNPPRKDLISFRLYLCCLLRGERKEAARVRENAAISFQSPAWFYIESIEASLGRNPSHARKLIESAQLMHGHKTRIFDQTLETLKLKP